MLYDRRKDLSQIGRDLIAAADYIRDHGWCQHMLWDYGGRVCIYGALIKVSEYPERNLGLIGGGKVILWNNAPGRTKEEVINLLEDTAWKELEHDNK